MDFRMDFSNFLVTLSVDGREKSTDSVSGSVDADCRISPGVWNAWCAPHWTSEPSLVYVVGGPESG